MEGCDIISTKPVEGICFMLSVCPFWASMFHVNCSFDLGSEILFVLVLLIVSLLSVVFSVKLVFPSNSMLVAFR